MIASLGNQDHLIFLVPSFLRFQINGLLISLLSAARFARRIDNFSFYYFIFFFASGCIPFLCLMNKMTEKLMSGPKTRILFIFDSLDDAIKLVESYNNRHSKATVATGLAVLKV